MPVLIDWYIETQKIIIADKISMIRFLNKDMAFMLQLKEKTKDPEFIFRINCMIQDFQKYVLHLGKSIEKIGGGSVNEKKDYEIISSIEMKCEIDERKDPEEAILSNLPSLDEAVKGFLPGELIAISGPTKNGKTLFAQSLTNEFTKQNAFPLWFSFEVVLKYFL
jgi:replicative DNA helicase